MPTQFEPFASGAKRPARPPTATGNTLATCPEKPCGWVTTYLPDGDSVTCTGSTLVDSPSGIRATSAPLARLITRTSLCAASASSCPSTDSADVAPMVLGGGSADPSGPDTLPVGSSPAQIVTSDAPFAF